MKNRAKKIFRGVFLFSGLVVLGLFLLRVTNPDRVSNSPKQELPAQTVSVDCSDSSFAECICPAQKALQQPSVVSDRNTRTIF